MTNPPTPPADVPPMPKIDMVRSTPEGCWHCYEVTTESPTTSIERAYATLSSMFQQERAENERLREALERTEHDLRRHDPTCEECNGIRPRVDLMRKRIKAALAASNSSDDSQGEGE